ncbi:MAG: hypothetical protein ABIH24_09050 [Verrucomicrobiota bacterium]
MDNWLLWTPFTFLLILFTTLILLRGLALFSSTSRGAVPGGKLKPYACGEDMRENRGQPDYSQFFPFAVFFTIMHVLALVVTTVPVHDWPAVEIAMGYWICSSIGLFILFRR